MELKMAFSATAATIIFFLSVLKLYNRSKPQNLPPGPWKLPIIGSMHHLVTRSLPHHALKRLSLRYGPLMHLQLGEISAVVVSSPQMAKLFMKTYDTAFGERPRTLASDVFSYNRSDLVFTPCNAHWKEMKKICTQDLLTNTRVKSFCFIREDETSNLIAFITRSTGCPINLRTKFFSLTSSITCRAAFSEKLSSQSSLVSLTGKAAALMGGLNLCDFFPSVKFLSLVTGMKSKVQKIHSKLDIIMDDIIMKRREKNEELRRNGEPGNDNEDLLDALLRLQQEDERRISDNIIKAVIFEMFAAGTETSALTMECAMYEMIKNPRVLENAQLEVRQSFGKLKNIGEESYTQGLHYLKLVIKETLRLHPPAPLLIPRECSEACEINGYSIPLKTKVIINAWAIGRDKESWENAEKFIPERFESTMLESNGKNFEFVPFGAGRRRCTGVSFAAAMIELVLAQLLYHFNWKLPDQVNAEELGMAETEGILMIGRTPLCLVADLNEVALVKK